MERYKFKTFQHVIDNLSNDSCNDNEQYQFIVGMKNAYSSVVI